VGENIMENTLTQFQLRQPGIGTGVDLDETSSINRRRILIVEDDPDTALLLKRVLILAGYDVSNALGGQEGLRKIPTIRPDLILLDLCMPDMDGWETLQYLKQITAAPVIIISANSQKDDVVRALMDGVDDYMTKPFFNAEVVARVKSVLRRSVKPEEMGRIIFPRTGLTIDFVSQEVSLRNRKVTLTPKEFAVLVTLAKQAPGIVRYQAISQSVWGENTTDAHNRTKYLVYLIRKKLHNIAPDITLLQNVDRIGYKLFIEE
jgi:two-component system KDP operon response regulator KdpE